jgi:hypothetical protein
LVSMNEFIPEVVIFCNSLVSGNKNTKTNPNLT